ncbi:hypothetical protein JET18_12795 [Chryseobacterium sp. L7]|uniref:Uncharacterized protein n=1 Tax=Chryseobacterium endalhagicum TaxID=2797638 RepID=A0ABS1QGI6_9FLAO|nr:hypothetical protein [Chryseobacterium endalhagicum]MBL1221721.1 hypothetical protein [Chryseobacterium endalhagicum]
MMKIKVLDYFIINKSKPNQKNILDVHIIEEGLLINKNFINNEKKLSFVIRSVGHINPSVENYYPVTVEIDAGNDLKDYKDLIFTDSL